MGQDDSPLHTPAALRAAWAVWLANALQFYDFFLFGTATVLYLGPVFFPDTEPELVELAAFASIGAGFLSRPLGAVLLGHLADALTARGYDKLYGARHYNHYEFLLALTDRLGGIGLEHHRSSENSADPGYFTEWDSNAWMRDLLPHDLRD